MFYRGDKAFQVVINFDSPSKIRKSFAKYEIYKSKEGYYRYRFKDGDGGIIYTDKNLYPDKASCLKAVQDAREQFFTAGLYEKA